MSRQFHHRYQPMTNMCLRISQGRLLNQSMHREPPLRQLSPGYSENRFWHITLCRRVPEREYSRQYETALYALTRVPVTFCNACDFTDTAAFIAGMTLQTSTLLPSIVTVIAPASTAVTGNLDQYVPSCPPLLPTFFKQTCFENFGFRSRQNFCCWVNFFQQCPLKHLMAQSNIWVGGATIA